MGRLARVSIALACSAVGLLAVSASAFAATSVTPLVSTSTAESASSGNVAAGTTFSVTFNETPVLGSSYRLQLTDGTDVGELSTSDGNLTASLSGNTITFSVTGAPVMTSGAGLALSKPLEILAASGISDSAGNPWNLVASGVVDKSYLLKSGDTVDLTYSAPVDVAGSYSFTLTEGTSSAVVDNSNSTVSGSGTKTLHITLTGAPSMNSGTALAADGPTVTSQSGISATPTVQVGDTLTGVFNGVVTATAPYSLTVADGSDTATLSSGSNVSATTTPGPGAGQTTVAFRVTAAPTMTAGSQLFTSGLKLTGASGGLVGTTNGTALSTSGPAPAAPGLPSASVSVDPTTTCSDGYYTRVFGGTNCSIGFGANSGPTSPDVFDVIALPTVDLPGPPYDNAPEVITNCATGSTDIAYDVNTGAELGANACGNNPDEGHIGNTFGPNLDYIATPKLASYEEVGVVETLPGSKYVSATAVPPQISSITVSGDQATITYYHAVVCQNTSSDAATMSQFTYETPYTDLHRSADSSGSGLVYPIAISCPSGTSNTIVVTYQNPIPYSSGLRFKFEGYGPGHFVVGAPGTPFAYEREASQSAYVGPGAAITAFTPQSTTTASSAGGAVTVSFTTSGALSCSLSAISNPANAAALALPSSSSCNGSETITVPANTSTTADAVYTVTLSATGVPGSPTATAATTITVPAAPVPKVLAPANQSLPTISGTARKGQTLLESHGSWSGTPTGYSYQWERCTSAGTSCAAISGANAQAYTLTSADVGHRLIVVETASNIAGPGSPASSVVTSVVTATSTQGHAGRPNTRLLSAKIKARSATFHMKAVGKATSFQCALVRKRAGKHSKPVYVKCAATKKYKHLRPGTYTFYVRAVGPGGADKTPATRTFKIA